MIIWLLDLQLPVHSVPITADFSNPAHGWRYTLDTTLCDNVCQWLAKVGCFLRILRFPPPIKTDWSLRYSRSNVELKHIWLGTICIYQLCSSWHQEGKDLRQLLSHLEMTKIDLVEIYSVSAETIISDAFSHSENV